MNRITLFCAVTLLLLSQSFRAEAADNNPMLLQFTDVVAKTVGLPLLREQPLTDGRKEIRIWFGFGVVEPEKMVRLMIDGVGHITGETYLYYRPQGDRRDSGDMKYFKELHKQCKVLATGTEKEVCVPVNDGDTPWATVYAEISNNDVWTLPDQSKLPKPDALISDGAAIVVELRDGEHYRAYSYSNPMFNPAPEAQKADAIMRALRKTGDVHIQF